MNTLKLTSQFKKDLKKYKHNATVLDKLEYILNLLVNNEVIPEEYRPHMLQGNYKNHMECHVENDTLLIWFDRDAPIIKLVRFGSHSELF
ncbi:MAG: type II toxin-antitoxin system YafQ family toxin [Lachnospiraceae bacterium]|nr:type II toxin-antitoxin system YafQ family toxin [Lachnospiraceae bacterium]